MRVAPPVTDPRMRAGLPHIPGRGTFTQRERRAIVYAAGRIPTMRFFIIGLDVGNNPLVALDPSNIEDLIRPCDEPISIGRARCVYSTPRKRVHQGAIRTLQSMLGRHYSRLPPRTRRNNGDIGRISNASL